MADICFLVLLDLLPLEVRSLESGVIVMIFNRDFMLGVFDRRIWVSPCTVSPYSGMIQGSYIPYLMVSHLREEQRKVSVRVRRVR